MIKDILVNLAVGKPHDVAGRSRSFSNVPGTVRAASSQKTSNNGSRCRSREPNGSRRSTGLTRKDARHQYAAHADHIAGKRNR